MKIPAKLISQLLIVSMVLLPFSAQAGMISTQHIAASAAVQADRDKVAGFIARADVQKQMEALGLAPANALDRVAALTDEEVQRVAGKLDSVPAGASGAGVVYVTVGVLILAVLAYIYWK